MSPPRGLPADTSASVQRALAAIDRPARIAAVHPVGGGCINNGARITMDGGAEHFLKWNARAPAGMFAAEADGLRALRATGALRVPEPIAWGEPADGAAWLVMELVPQQPPAPDSDERLGRGLSAVHGAEAPAFGWERDNWIGSLPQSNGPTGSWGEFWRDRRLRPQIERAVDSGLLDSDPFDRLLDVVAGALTDVTRPGLLHGDLWSGNAFTTTGGEPVVIDPAVYAGDGEVDLAMTELFGGFGTSFYDAYREARGTSAAYDAYRRSLYQLYYLLVHVNLFGGGYVGSARRTAEQVLAELG